MDSEFRNMFCAHPLLWLHLQYQFKEAHYDYSMKFGKSILELTALNDSSQRYDLLILDEPLSDGEYYRLPESVKSTENGNEYSIQLYSLPR